jgi:glutamate-1-semialdehyde 2,1-aminomutase
MERLISKKIFEKSREVFPGGVNSPVRSFQGLGISPIVVKSGLGDTLTDMDGGQYIDYCMSWGALILGHRPERVINRVKEQLERGTAFGAATEEELNMAGAILSHFPSIEKIRFVSSGAEAVSAALRLARGFTGRQTILKFDHNYHGAIDSLLLSSAGIPKHIHASTLSLPYNDIEALKKFFEKPRNDVAAVIIEPVAGNMGVVPASLEFLELLRRYTIENQTLLIFDEVISGFRVGLSGAQGLYGVLPDLTTFGKIIGGGFPAAAVGGSKEIMDHLSPLGSVYHAGTLSGNPIAMKAGLATLEMLEQPQFYEELEKKAQIITRPIEKFIQEQNLQACVNQVGSMFTIFFGTKSVCSSADLQKVNLDLFRKFFQYLFVKGIYAPPSAYEAWFVSSAHTQAHLEKTRDVILQFLNTL